MKFSVFEQSLELHPEAHVHPHVPTERAELFEAASFESAEIEYLGLVYALVRASKPQRVLETGTHHGIGACCIAAALHENSIRGGPAGRLCTVEFDMQTAIIARDRLLRLGLSDFAEVVHSQSLDYLDTADLGVPFDLVFFDSTRRDRVGEYRKLRDRGAIRDGAVLIFHDTSEERGKSLPSQSEVQQIYLSELEQVVTDCGLGINLSLSRGMRIFQRRATTLQPRQ